MLTTTPAIFTDWFLAIILGVISPKIRIIIVIPTVATATDELDVPPIILIVTTVAIDEASIFTILFPTKSPVNISLGFFNHFFKSSTFLAFFPSSNFSRCILLNDVSAVSEAEKKPDNIINTTNNKIFWYVSNSFLHSPSQDFLFYIILFYHRMIENTNYSISNSLSPFLTIWPSSTRIFTILQFFVAFTSFISFIASIIHRVSPTETFIPASIKAGFPGADDL